MMDLQPYPEYKDSEVEWLGHIPIDWEVMRIKMSVESARNGIWGQEPDVSGSPVWCVRVADFDRKSQTVDATERTMRVVTADELIPRRLRRGDLLLEKSGGGENNPVGFVVRYDHEDIAVCSNFVAKVRLRPGMDSRFWTYVHATTYSVRLTQRSIKQTSGIQNLDQASYFNELAPVPPFETQNLIADFLDRETSQIDELIGKQERLIGLLTEKRQSIITHAITKGLDPTAPTKPSDIPWLGEVAAHWAIVELKHVVDILTGFPFKSEDFTEDPDDVPLLRGVNVNPGQTNWVDTVRFPRRSSDEYSNYQLGLGDLVLGLDRPIVSNGTRVCSIEESDLPALVLQRVARIRTNDKADQEFVGHVLASSIFSSYLEPLFTGVSVPHMSPGQLREFKIAIPPLHEQEAIARSLGHSLKKLDVLVDRSRSAIALLRERRSALISAAVTGKIDVREKVS